MKIISIETSGPVCSVALSDGDSFISELYNSDGNRHDELCAEFVRRLLVEKNLTISNIDAIAVSSGPGSFTGLRIGASIAKALCFKESENDYAPRLIAVPTLSAFANEAMENINFQKVPNFRKVENTKIIAFIPAQKDYLYYQIFTRRPELVEGQPDLDTNVILSLSKDELVEGTEIKLSHISDFKSLDFIGTFLCGPNTNILPSLPAPPYQIEYSAKHIAKLAIKKYKAGEFTDANTFKPLYVQDFQVKKRK